MRIHPIAALAWVAKATLFCHSESSPNPIASQYPHLTTGTINGTVAIIPVPLSYVRSIVPAEYPILTSQYQALLPWFPKDMFPMMMQTELDHDVQGSGIKIPDFQRGGFSFPFIDRLNDGYTGMAYGSKELISAVNIAVLGTAAYGYNVISSVFDPPCDAYECADVQCKSRSFKGFDVLRPLAGPVLSTNFTDSTGSPYPLSFYKNITNQPQFSDNKLVCDNYIRLYNASITTGEFVPIAVKGTVSVVAPLLPQTTSYSDVWGLRMDNAFIENNFKPCKSLQGYTFSD